MKFRNDFLYLEGVNCDICTRVIIFELSLYVCSQGLGTEYVDEFGTVKSHAKLQFV